MKVAIAGHCPQCGEVGEPSRFEDYYNCRNPKCKTEFYEYWKRILDRQEIVGRGKNLPLIPSPEAIAIENYQKTKDERDKMLELLKENHSEHECSVANRGWDKGVLMEETKAFLAKIGEPELKESFVNEINESIAELDDPAKHKTFNSSKEFLDELEQDTPPDEK